LRGAVVQLSESLLVTAGTQCHQFDKVGWVDVPATRRLARWAAR
jgi:hypothetical protein